MAADTVAKTPPELDSARERFLELVAELRPELHRYAARLTGSLVDGEDVVQDTLAKAFYALSRTDELPPLRPFLFRIAHNTALDTLRRYERKHVEPSTEAVAEAADERADPEVVRAALGTFLELPVTRRHSEGRARLHPGGNRGKHGVYAPRRESGARARQSRN